MTRIMMFLLVAMMAMAVGAPTGSTAGEAAGEPPKTDNSCSCTARHESMVKLRELLKTMKAEQLALQTGESNEPKKIPAQ